MRMIEPNEFDDSKIAYLLNKLQRYGDINSRILGALINYDDTENMLNFLKKRFSLLISYLVRPEPLGLQLYFIEGFLHPLVHLVDIYDILDGFPGAILKNSYSPDESITFLWIPQGYESSFKRILDELESRDLLRYSRINKIQETLQFLYDFSSYDFSLGRYKDDFLVSQRRPMYLPDLSDGFKPDMLDLSIIGIKQMHNTLSLKQVAEIMGVKYRTVLKHYHEHLIGKGIITGFMVRLNGGKHTRLSIIFDNEDLLHDLTRIPTLTHVYKLRDGTFYAAIFPEDNMIQPILKYISELKYNLNVSAKVMAHPFMPRFEYLLTASIPYEHFTTTGKWEVDEEKMLMNIEKVERKLMEGKSKLTSTPEISLFKKIW
ncbi:hypothetical protein [Metallosphaera hakonensis]|uniref:Lrp/AsnC family transcriptional regulator n=1 Tax=Metallosphaera hakonensis JCM 8857 = DSM 7519 TaxID=1293036 RepID=A0A2U9IWH6_9CREN|nr:hypothetical protein [Metallosphaera hakonensis]AWS00399.1 hypothetical protein DFR87_12745 [Metallosphaera hakonensis JCM 8857 = DSM 7519]